MDMYVYAKNGTNGKGNGKVLFVCYKRKQETKVSFPWLANDKVIEDCCVIKRTHLWLNYCSAQI